MPKLSELIFAQDHELAMQADSGIADCFRRVERRAESMMEDTVAASIAFDRYMTQREAAPVEAALTAIRKRSLLEGADIHHVNAVKYPKINGMEGPFRYANGAILYYDLVTQSYFNMDQNRNLSHNEVAEAIGLTSDLFESVTRSDSEVAFFFDSRDLAKHAFNVAQQHGLAEGEVWLDKNVDPAFGMGRYAVRFAPHVRYEKASQFVSILDDLSEYVIDEDVDQYGWVQFLTEEYLSEIVGKGDAKGKVASAAGKLKAKVKAKADYGGMSKEKWQQSVSGGVGGFPFDYNPFHTSRNGKFSSPPSIIGAGGLSSQSYKKAWARSKGKVRKDGAPYLFYMATKLPCGRAARLKSVKGKDRYRRCWDGKRPEWAGGA